MNEGRQEGKGPKVLSNFIITALRENGKEKKYKEKKKRRPFLMNVWLELETQEKGRSERKKKQLGNRCDVRDRDDTRQKKKD